MSILPPELLDAIFSHLHTDNWEDSWDKLACGKLDLDACSRVSHSWNAAAVPHLFRDIVYSFRPVPYNTPYGRGEYSTTNPLDFSSASKSKPDARYKTLPMFYAFVQHSPFVQNSIRRLGLENRPRRDGFRLYDDTDCPDADVFIELLHLLPRLRVLRLHNFTVAPGPTLATPVAHPSLKSVFISSQSSRSDDPAGRREWIDLNVSAVLDCFTKLEELHLDLHGLPMFPPSLQKEPPFEINKLVLEDSSCLGRGLGRYLCDDRHTRSIRTLTLKSIYPDTTEEDLAQIGPIVKNLHVCTPGSDELGEQFWYTTMTHQIVYRPGIS